MITFSTILSTIYVIVCIAALVFIVIGIAWAAYTEMKALKLRKQIENAINDKEDSE